MRDRNRLANGILFQDGIRGMSNMNIISTIVSPIAWTAGALAAILFGPRLTIHVLTGGKEPWRYRYALIPVINATLLTIIYYKLWHKPGAEPNFILVDEQP